jgi:hypothetical protein
MAFNGCAALMEVVFPTDSHLRAINVFQECTSLIEEFSSWVFENYTALMEVVFAADSHLRVPLNSLDSDR